MLKNFILDYYYYNISTSIVTLNFEQTRNFISNYFKEAKYKQKVFFKWNKLIFIKLVISKN